VDRLYYRKGEKLEEASRRLKDETVYVERHLT